MKFEEKTIQQETIFEGKVITVEQHEVKLPNDKESIREIVKHRGAVCILAVKDNKVLFVEQYRKAMEHNLIEIPAGKLEPNETRENTALRELEEETGYSSKNIKKLFDFYVSPGFCNEYVSLFLADDLFEQNELSLDEDEFVRKFWLTTEEMKSWLAEGKFQDAKTIIAVQYYLSNCI